MDTGRCHWGTLLRAQPPKHIGRAHNFQYGGGEENKEKD